MSLIPTLTTGTKYNPAFLHMHCAPDRSTVQLVEKGWYEFWNWFDYESWYPLGRVVGGTVRVSQ